MGGGRVELGVFTEIFSLMSISKFIHYLNYIGIVWQVVGFMVEP
jgi:hypothetical protein